MRPSSALSTAVLALLAISAAASAGELEVKDLRSEALDQTLKVNILLPDGYRDDATRRFPVVYLLHGFGGDYREWERVGVVPEAAGLAAIVVMPEGDKSFYVNHHEDMKARWEDYISKELVAFVDAGYRTLAQREGRAISGLSMGGYGAMAVGLRHPELYASVASHSGAVSVPNFTADGEIAQRLLKIFGPEGSKARTDYDLFRLVKDLAPAQRPHIYIDCGSGDFLLESNRKFVAHLATLKVPYEYRETPGGHDFRYWKSNVRYSLTQQLKALETAAQTKKELVASSESGGDFAGAWKLTVNYGDQDLDYDLRIQQEAGTWKAVLISPRSGEHPFKSVSVKDGALRMEIDRDIEGNSVTFVYEGKLQEGKLKGKVTLAGQSDFSGEFEGEKKKATSL